MTDEQDGVISIDEISHHIFTWEYHGVFVYFFYILMYSYILINDEHLSIFLPLYPCH
jgi:hypothetical protein